MLDKSQNITAGCSADVYYKACVLFAYLRAADGISLKAALLNKCACEMTLGSLKYASCRWEIERLLILAAADIIVHPGAYIGSIILFEFKLRRQNNILLAGEAAVAVG